MHKRTMQLSHHRLMSDETNLEDLVLLNLVEITEIIDNRIRNISSS